MSKINKGLFTSSSGDYETPQDLFDRLNEIFHFDIDVCAVSGNAKCKRFFSPDNDGLEQTWSGERYWMNPPYGKSIVGWVEKAYWSGLNKDTTVVGLLPARTDTRWYHDYFYSVFSPEERGLRKVELKGRLRFNGLGSAPFPSMLICWGKYVEGFHSV